MNDESVLQNTIEVLRNDGVVVVRTDTLYGIIALAASEKGVSKVFEAKHRNAAKQCIILAVAAPADSQYGAYVEQFSGEALLPTSVIVPASNEPKWLLRGGDSLAYRVTRDPFLRKVIEVVGPVIAPSANPEGLPPARTIDEAQQYFGAAVDYYVDGGEVPETIAASEILKVNKDETVELVRSQFYPSGTKILKQHHSAGGVLFKDDKVLLIHWDPPRSSYDFPKGTIEHGESSEAAAVREVYEETGYKTRTTKFIDSNSYYLQTPRGEWRYKTVDYYLLELEDETQYNVQRELYETFENAWVSIAEAEAIITREINKDIFRKALLAR